METGALAKSGTLYVVGTPIGNLGDLTFRARDILATVDLIACEDTRHSLPLLQRYGIKKPLLSLHQHNEVGRAQHLLKELRAGKSVACITDAGMPSISDPGQRLVHEVRRGGVACEIIPGPSAPITALAGSGLPSTAFYFGGFLPVKQGQRQRMLEGALAREETSIFFESPHRLLASLSVLAQLAPERLICVARELTKKFEEFHTANAAVCQAHFQSHPVKGEITLIIAGTDLPKWLRTDSSAQVG
ncbi:MAG: 16S rRNA (cytidine(1402)-2'-O)-methyltransferase [Verrucomicrobiales bacterium]